MDKSDLRIVYMGTPDFAVESLKSLVEGGYNVVGVVTMPDKPAGRGQKVRVSPVKEYALNNDLPLLQPEKLKDESFLSELRALKADLQIVVAFRMLPEVVWNMPRFGTFNLHASLLPQYRGAAPINWAIINGETETGVTTFFLTHEIDTGQIIFQEKVSIEESDNAGTLHDKLMTLGATLVAKTVDVILDESVESIDQTSLVSTHSHLVPAPKIFKETCVIDWDETAETIYNFVRGLSPYPAAVSTLHIGDLLPVQVKIYEVEPLYIPHSYPKGRLFVDQEDGYLNVTASNGFIKVISLQLPGKKRVDAREWLKGFRHIEDSVFE